MLLISRQLALSALMLATAALPAGAVEIRNYQAARHDRFTGSPATPAWNSSAWFTSSKFTGVGWSAEAGDQRQFALVSPLHIVCATHYQPPAGLVIRFLGSSGNIVERTVVANQPVNDSMGATDLSLTTLSSPISAAEGVTPFPYLNLSSDNNYLNSSLTVFGWTLRAGSGRIARFSNYTHTSGAVTRMIEFDYRIQSGGQDDCYLASGDSGSPSFAMSNSQPALVGLHFLTGENSQVRTGYDTFVPHYITQLNTLMAPDGYRMRPATISAPALAAQMEAEPAQPRQGAPGSCQFDLTNSSSNDAGNVRLTLRFPAGAGPTSVASPGWVVESNSGTEWILRRAILNGQTTVSITATWAALPLVETLAMELEHSADGSPLKVNAFPLSLDPSYASWSAGLAEPGQEADADSDGVANIIEYGFGSDPESGAPHASGQSLLPALSWTGGTTFLSFPVREDAAQRGLSYVVEFSDSLQAGSWSTTAPPGLTVTDGEFLTEIPGLNRRTVTFQPSGARGFCRVGVLLSE